MTMSLADLGRSVYLLCKRAGLKLAGISSETHCAAHRFDSDQVSQLEYHRIRRFIVEFGRVGSFELGDVPGKFDCSALHTQADSKVRRLLPASIAEGSQHAGNAALAEPARNQYGVEVAKAILPVRIIHQFFGLKPTDLNAQSVSDPAVHQRFVEALIRVLELHVLAN